MKKIFLIITISFLFSLATNGPIGAATDYKLLAPLPLSGADKGDDTKTTAVPYLKGIFMLAIAIATGLAVIRIIFGGINYLAVESITGKSDAKQTIQNAIWGLLLVIGAWLILYTINPELVNFKLELKTLSTGVAGGTTGGGSVGGGLVTGIGGEPLSQAAAVKALRDAGIVVPGALILEGLRQGVVDELVRLKSECSTCVITLNSATGGVHDETNQPVCNHKNGYKVDLQSRGTGAALTDYITTSSKFTKLPGKRSDGATLYAPVSNSKISYALENNPPHWDITVC